MRQADKLVRVDLGILTIAYSSASGHTADHLQYIDKRDFDRLFEVVHAYRSLVEIRGRRRTSPEAQIRHQVCEMLDLPQPKSDPMPRRDFPLTLYRVLRRPLGSRITAIPDRSVILKPWLFSDVELCPPFAAVLRSS